jgi:hypothetical protein
MNSNGLKKNLTIINEVQVQVEGQQVSIQEYEPDPDGVFLKICTTDDALGVASEYAWLREFYPGYKFIKQTLAFMELNGKKVTFDVLDIKTAEGVEKKIYFDISEFSVI